MNIRESADIVCASEEIVYADESVVCAYKSVICADEGVVCADEKIICASISVTGYGMADKDGLFVRFVRFVRFVSFSGEGLGVFGRNPAADEGFLREAGGIRREFQFDGRGAVQNLCA